MNTKEDIINKLSAIFAEDFEINPETLTVESRLYEDLGLDSIDAVDLIVKLQELIGKRIKPEQFKQVRTVQNVVDVIYALLQDNPS
jgi:acyl carrier protein